MTRLTLAAMASLGAVLFAAPAWAQFDNTNNAVSIRPKAEATGGPAPVVQPPALPGAQSQGGAAPATKLATDMAPSEALFDAINRGDITAARDALSRGADLNAQNVLGMTPMELSVDLGRNDIAFLLLSMRGETPRSRTATAQSGGAAGAKTAAAKTTGRKPVPIKVVAGPANRADQAPRLFANDGGAPVPSAGFLGFDAGRGMR
ncbi:MAG: ankyrin repeat domain-containing protein [Acetobacteraceae bacterium]|nr:ankyrin repeat domain-containing protein [Acetobacteraceae bacterium]